MAAGNFFILTILPDFNSSLFQDNNSIFYNLLACPYHQQVDYVSEDNNNISLNYQLQQNVQKYFGPISSKITQAAVEAIQLGDAKLLGALMTKAQAEFDRHVVPACPEQLIAKKLHTLLHHKPLKPYIYGGKGVGSQGDGTAQLIVKNQESQREAIKIIKRDFPQMQALQLTIS